MDRDLEKLHEKLHEQFAALSNRIETATPEEAPALIEEMRKLTERVSELLKMNRPDLPDRR